MSVEIRLVPYPAALQPGPEVVTLEFTEDGLKKAEELFGVESVPWRVVREALDARKPKR